MKDICQDLMDECESLDALVTPLSEEQWNRITPFMGWSIKIQIAHLAYFDSTAGLAVTDAKAFKKHVTEVFVNEKAYLRSQQKLRSRAPATVLKHWLKERKALLGALKPLNRKDRFPWYGPPMSALSLATARLMETWAHGQDVADTLKTKRPSTDRLRHVAHLGVLTFGWSFANRGMEVPDVKFRVALTSPSGEPWIWGPGDAAESISGPAEDFCLVAVQRRHLDDTRLKIEGDAMRQWMQIAQAFAGPPATGPKAGERAFDG
ncbi:MAG: TIGR03084 family metal-binding protein [Desulfobacterales bacterium]